MLIFAFAVAVTVVSAVTPVMIRVADRTQFHDHPVGYKGHVRATPYLGGTAVVTGSVAATLLFAGDAHLTLPVITGVMVLWAVGTVDDRRTVSPSARVVVEVALAAFLWAQDVGWHIGLGGGIDLAITVLWVLAVVNALNLFDNMDGQATTIAAVIASATAVLGVIDGDQWLAVTGAALAGACLGFLRYNLTSPARIFLGDGGSMPVGFALASIVMIGADAAEPAGQALAMGLLLVGIPALDTALVIVSRTRREIPLMTGGQDHLTHRTRQRLGTPLAVALALGASQALLAVIALAASYRGGSALLFVAATLYVLISVVVIVLLDRDFEPLVARKRSPAVAADAPE